MHRALLDGMHQRVEYGRQWRTLHDQLERPLLTADHDLGLLALRDIAREAARMNEPAVLDIDVRADQGMLDGAVLAAQTGLVIGRFLIAAQPLENGFDRRRVSMKFRNVPAEVLVAPVTEQIEIGLVGPQNDAVGADPMQAEQGVLDEILELGLAAPQRLVGAPPLGDVAADARRADHRARVIDDRRHRERDVDPPPVPGQAHRFQWRHALAPRQARVHTAQLLEPVPRHEHLDRAPDHLGGGVAVHPLGRGVPAGDRAIEPLAEDRIGAEIDDRGEPGSVALKLRGRRSIHDGRPRTGWCCSASDISSTLYFARHSGNELGLQKSNDHGRGGLSLVSFDAHQLTGEFRFV